MERGTLPELERLESLLERLRHPLVHVRTIHTEHHQGRDYPIYTITLGRPAMAQQPTFLIMGGVHGLERIGTQVIIAYMETLASRLRWDQQLQHLLERVQLVLLPLFNPVGVLLHRRANARGVDLMRNAPVRTKARVLPPRLYQGQALSARLPYYRGKGVEPEVLALEQFFREVLFQASTLLTLDVHSGFGNRDQLWFPHAYSRRMFPQTAEMMALTQLLEEASPHHRYVIEPQSRQYTVHGDLWDYLHDLHNETRGDAVFLPLTLELASWGWIRKNPRQFVSRLGLFHPIKPHRVTRVLRRHLGLFDLLSRVTAAPDAWTGFDEAMRHTLEHEARRLWPELE